MPLFSRKIPASEGLSLVAASAALAAFEGLPLSKDAASVAGFVVAYVRSRRSQFHLPNASLERLIEFTLSILAQRRPDLRPFSMAYIASAGVAMRLFDEKRSGNLAQCLYEMSEDRAMSLPEFLQYAKTVTEAADEMIKLKSGSWKHGQ